VNIEQLKVFASGMINLANLIFGVALVTPIFGSGPLTLNLVVVPAVMAAIVLYAGALDILRAV
jgi:predicted branched-subunit amino acid permease